MSNYTISLTTKGAESTTVEGFGTLADALERFEAMELPQGSIIVLRDERAGTILDSYREEFDSLSIAR